MSLTIVVSGPKTSRQQAQTALAAAAFDVQPTEHHHGLPEQPEAKPSKNQKVRQAIAFVTVHGDDIDRAHAAVESLGWTLRAHWLTPEPAPPDPLAGLAQRLADMQAEIDALKAGGTNGS